MDKENEQYRARLPGAKCSYALVELRVTNNVDKLKPPLHRNLFKLNQCCSSVLKCTYSQQAKVTQTTQ